MLQKNVSERQLSVLNLDLWNITPRQSRNGVGLLPISPNKSGHVGFSFMWCIYPWKNEANVFLFEQKMTLLTQNSCACFLPTLQQRNLVRKDNFSTLEKSTLSGHLLASYYQVCLGHLFYKWLSVHEKFAGAESNCSPRWSQSICFVPCCHEMCFFLCRMQGRQSVIHHCHKYETKFILCLFFLRWHDYRNPSSHPCQPPPELLISMLSFWGCSGGLCNKVVSLIKFLWHMPKNREMKTNRADRLWWKDVFG